MAEGLGGRRGYEVGIGEVWVMGKGNSKGKEGKLEEEMELLIQMMILDKMERKMQVVSVFLLSLFFQAKVSCDVFSCVYLNWREFVLRFHCK